MKTKILYTTSAMVLALMAGRAQAETGTKIAPYEVVHPQVDFVSTFGLTKGSELKFGVVVNPQSGQSITVTPDGRVSSSYSGGNATQNATLLGMGMINSEKSIDVSTISPGSVTVSGHIGTLNKAGTVKLLFPTEAVTLSDGGTTCGSVVINPALDGENGVVTGRQSGENPGLYYYGGTLTLSTNATGKHCVGNGNVTLVFDDSSVYQPDQFNDPVDDFSLIPPEPAELPEEMISGYLVPQTFNENYPVALAGGISFDSEFTSSPNSVFDYGITHVIGNPFSGRGAALGLLVPSADSTWEQELSMVADMMQAASSGQEAVPIIVLAEDRVFAGSWQGSTMTVAMSNEHEQYSFTEEGLCDSCTNFQDIYRFSGDTLDTFTYNVDLNTGAYQLTNMETVNSATFAQMMQSKFGVSVSAISWFGD